MVCLMTQAMACGAPFLDPELMVYERALGFINP
jgi:hypothetical protein